MDCLGNQASTGAGLASDQGRGVGMCTDFDLIPYPAGRGTHADELHLSWSSGLLLKIPKSSFKTSLPDG
jgi:hypothetical protein